MYNYWMWTWTWIAVFVFLVTLHQLVKALERIADAAERLAPKDSTIETEADIRDPGK